MKSLRGSSVRFLQQVPGRSLGLLRRDLVYRRRSDTMGHSQDHHLCRVISLYLRRVHQLKEAR